MTALYYMKVYGLDPYTITFFGRTMAEKDNSYLTRSVKELIPNMGLYQNSRTKFKNQKLPYLYPVYGLGDIVHVFDRLCKVYGEDSMLNQQIDDFIWQGNKTAGLKYGSKHATAPIIIGDPSYFSEISGKIKKVGQIIRAFASSNTQFFQSNPNLIRQ